MDGIQTVGEYSYVRVQPGDEESLKQAVRQIGPVVAMFQVEPEFLLYSDGIYGGSKECSSSTIDHSLLIVGFGTDPKTKEDFWIV